MFLATFEDAVPSNATDVPSNDLISDAGQGTGRQRSERLRVKRDAAGLAQVSGWVPKERRAYAREVLAALARGTNSLPPDPEQTAELEKARDEAEAARAAEATVRTALAAAERHGRAVTSELDAARAQLEAARDAGRQAEAAAAQARVEVERFQAAPGLRARAIRWLVSRPAAKSA